jgi:hypothetical protein
LQKVKQQPGNSIFELPQNGFTQLLLSDFEANQYRLYVCERSILKAPLSFIRIIKSALFRYFSTGTMIALHLKAG